MASKVTAASLARVVEGLAKAVDAMREELDTLKQAFFGGWNKELNADVPGMVASMKETKAKVEAVEQKMSELGVKMDSVGVKVDALRDRRAQHPMPKWIWYGVGIIMGIVILRLLGLPVDAIGRLVYAALKAYGITL